MNNNSSIKKKICSDLLLKESQLNQIILRAPYSYKKFYIPKKNGGKRLIAQPAKETKYVQNWLVENVFGKLPINSSATAYSKGCSIKANAKIHRNKSYLLKLDFKDFFSSIKSHDLERHFSFFLNDIISLDDARDIARICCIKDLIACDLSLSVGAPSSPILSNTVMAQFDDEVCVWCDDKGISYSRYADDMAFSTNTKGLSAALEIQIRKILDEIQYPNLKINAAKTTHLSKKSQRRITGIIINNKGELSLGRERKRKISAMIHQFKNNSIDESDIYVLQGLIGFAKDIEPSFVSYMTRKYGSDLISKIFNARKKVD